MEEYLSVTLTKYLKMKFDQRPYLEQILANPSQVSNFVSNLLTNISRKDDHADYWQPSVWVIIN